MTDEQPVESEDSQRLSRLSRLVPPPDAQADDPIVREYEQRYQGDREEKPKRKPLPRSYSTLQVTDEEKMWAAIAHASAWITALTSVVTVGFLAPISIFIPLVIYLMFRKKSDYVAFHALQAFVLQLIGTVGALAVFLVGGAVWLLGLVIAIALMVILVGFILVPVWALVGLLLGVVVALLPVLMVVFGTIAALETYNGRDYRYPRIAAWVDRQLSGGLLNAH